MLLMTAKQEATRAAIRENRDLLARAEAERNDLIAQARRQGIEWQDICEDAGLVRMTATRYAAKANGGVLPKPGDPAPRRRTKKAS